MPMTIELKPDIEERMNRIVRKTGWSKEKCLLMFVEDGLADAEEYFESTEILEKVNKGEMKTYTDEELGKSLGLDT